MSQKSCLPASLLHCPRPSRITSQQGCDKQRYKREKTGGMMFRGRLDRWIVKHSQSSRSGLERLRVSLVASPSGGLLLRSPFALHLSLVLSLSFLHPATDSWSSTTRPCTLTLGRSLCPPAPLTLPFTQRAPLFFSFFPSTHATIALTAHAGTFSIAPAPLARPHASRRPGSTALPCSTTRRWGHGAGRWMDWAGWATTRDGDEEGEEGQSYRGYL